MEFKEIAKIIFWISILMILVLVVGRQLFEMWDVPDTTSINLLTPAGGEKVLLGENLQISWEAVDVPAGALVRLEAYLIDEDQKKPNKNNENGIAQTLCANGNIYIYENCNHGLGNSLGYYNWTLPKEDPFCAEKRDLSLLEVTDSERTGILPCLESGEYKIVAKLYLGDSTWTPQNLRAGSGIHSILAIDESPPFTISSK